MMTERANCRAPATTPTGAGTVEAIGVMAAFGLLWGKRSVASCHLQTAGPGRGPPSLRVLRAAWRTIIGQPSHECHARSLVPSLPRFRVSSRVYLEQRTKPV